MSIRIFKIIFNSIKEILNERSVELKKEFENSSSVLVAVLDSVQVLVPILVQDPVQVLATVLVPALVPVIVLELV